MQQFFAFLAALAAYASQLVDPFQLLGAYEVQLYLQHDENWQQASLINPLPVLMLDDVLHTDERPRCSDLTCPCWSEVHEMEAALARQFIVC
jgi:hypothetical protein